MGLFTFIQHSNTLKFVTICASVVRPELSIMRTKLKLLIVKRYLVPRVSSNIQGPKLMIPPDKIVDVLRCSVGHKFLRKLHIRISNSRNYYTAAKKG